MWLCMGKYNLFVISANASAIPCLPPAESPMADVLPWEFFPCKLDPSTFPLSVRYKLPIWVDRFNLLFAFLGRSAFATASGGGGGGAAPFVIGMGASGGGTEPLEGKMGGGGGAVVTFKGKLEGGDGGNGGAVACSFAPGIIFEVNFEDTAATDTVWGGLDGIDGGVTACSFALAILFELKFGILGLAFIALESCSTSLVTVAIDLLAMFPAAWSLTGDRIGGK